MEEKDESRPPGFRKPPTLSIRSRIYRYKCLLKRTWWVPFLAVSSAFCLQGYYISQEPATYVSQSKMWVSGKVNLPESSSLYREELQNFFGTQIELIRSAKIQTRAQARAKLLDPKLEVSGVMLKVAQAPRAAVFILQGVGTDPAYTRAFLQSLMEEYLAYKKEIRGNSAAEAISAITEQVYRPREELNAGQEALLQFKASNNVVFLTEQGSSAGSYLAKLNSRLVELKTELQLLELFAANDLPEAQKLPNSPTEGKAPEGKTSDLNTQLAGYQAAREKLLALKADRQTLGQDLKDKHPKMIAMDRDITRQETALEFYRQQSKEQLVSTRQSLKLQIQNLEQSTIEWKIKADESNRRMAEYERLKNNVDRLQSLSEKLTTLGQSVGVNNNLDQENVSIMENASTAVTAPIATGRKLLIAGFFGLLIGAGILYFVDRHDDRISSINELMQSVDLPVIGHVPGLSIRRGHKLELVQLSDKRHAFVEAFRDVRSALLFTADKGVRPKTILVTSAIPNEGKSSVSANLAVTLAISGARVLLVDADLRLGTAHKIFGTPNEIGLHEVLTGRATIADVVLATQNPNLHLLPSGKACSNAGELFLSSPTDQFIKDVYPHYDFIIIDSAPVLATADTASFAPKLDGVIFVVRGAFTSMRLSRNAIELLQQRQVNILGLVLNRADTEYPEYYQYKYSKYYHRTAVPA